MLWKAPGHRVRARRRNILGPFAESLERRQVPALLGFPAAVTPVLEAEPNDSVDLAQPLGDLSVSPMAGAHGTIGDGPAGAADVDWYQFTLDAPASVSLVAGPSARGDSFQGVLSLYNEDLYDFGDPLDPLGRRVLAQTQAAAPGGLASLAATLGPGSYDVAVSGAGNRLFNPLMAGSGYPGSTGDYNVILSSQALPLAAGSGPILLSSSPTAGAAIDRSPLAIRLDLSAPINFDPTTDPGSTVQLLSNPNGTFGDGHDVAVPLASANFSLAVNELQLFPASALPPGYYRVVLTGLTGLDGTPLGADALHPQGQDVRVSFQVTGIEGGQAADDTLATAHELGDVAHAPIVQFAGAIGDDPYYDSTSPDPALNPGNDVDFYRFHLDGAGPYALSAEVFAGRIGSPLDPGIALYRVDPSTKLLRFIAGNNNTENQATATDGTEPLLTDAALFASLTAGDYIVAVSSGLNTPSPLEGQPLHMPGLYDPNVSHSGQDVSSTGPYVLNLSVQKVPVPPRVVTASLANGSVLTASPTQFSVQFSEAVNLQQVAYQAYLQNSQSAISCVYVQGADGTKHFPRLQSIDPTTNRATFLMLDGLPNGSYQLHLSGAAGLTDFGGNPLVGNDPSGDYVVHFTVSGPARGDGADPRTWWALAQGGGVSKNLASLYPHELQAGVTVIRVPVGSGAPSQGGIQDDYQFRVLQDQIYLFTMLAPGPLPPDPLWLTDVHGGAVSFVPQGDGSAIVADLAPGVYVLHVGQWSPDQAASLTYRLTMTLIGNPDNPIPLVDGPAPAIQISLAGFISPPGSPSEGGSTSSGSPGTDTSAGGGSASFEPIGGSEMAGPIAGGSGTVGPIGGGAGSASTSIALASSLAQPEAAGGLSGLALGPLGGFGGQTGPLAAPTIQVALNVPAANAPSYNSLAVSLVTLTQVFASNQQGEGEDEGIEPVESSHPPGIMATDTPGPSEEKSGDAEIGLPTDPRGGFPAPNPSPVTAGGPPLGLMVPFVPSAMIVPAGPLAPDVAPAPRAGIPTNTAKAAPAPAPAVGDEAYVEPGTGMARWAIAAATLAAVYRGHEVFRGLGLRKMARQCGTPPEGPVAPRAPYGSTKIAHPAGGALSLHAARSRSRRGVPI